MTSDPDWEAFQSGLTWQPIGGYNRAAGRVVVLRNGDDEAVGFWDAGWWNAQESLDDQRLRFEPVEFADVDDDWRVALMAD